MPDVSPMMQHYLQTKEEYPDCILFYRLGDFYEMFFDDAVTVSRELELTLTGKNCGLPERAPMCGVPFHAADTYIHRLVKKGYKVAVCEQMEDPKLAKGIVKREVIRVVTPGTTTDMQSLDEQKNNYLCCAMSVADGFGLAVSDVSTGEFFVTQLDDLRRLTDEIYRYAPSEMICNDAFLISGINIEEIKEKLKTAVSSLDEDYFREEEAKSLVLTQFQAKDADQIGLAGCDIGVTAAGALLRYLKETQKNSLSNISSVTPYTIGRYMVLDNFTRKNLELCETLREKQKRGSLLWVVDKTKTSMGARLLRQYLQQPLIDREEILKRQDLIETINADAVTREELREYLSSIYDLQRLCTRICYQTANPRDLIAFKNSIRYLPAILDQLTGLSGALAQEISDELDPLSDLYALLDASIQEDPPIAVREGGILKDGYHEQVDRLRKAKTDGKGWLADLEAKERERTGIKTLRIRYNKVFGYCLEVTNSFKDQVPDRYIRKQTLSNAERYITPELSKLQDDILGASDRLAELEYDLFCDVRNRIGAEVVRIEVTAKAIAELDVFLSLAVVAERQHYCRPKINEDGLIDIKGGRHPVVEQMIENGQFVENDAYLDRDKNRIAIITGPNMAGKSTYMRQNALIVLMAQIGSFVPAQSANIGITDRIFTRVGASDDLASGQSTFMVEMNEVANILHNATRNSLLILDEIGRGTSTFDGLSIAWAVVEYISDPRLLGAKTFFATHYHELTELEGRLQNVHNFNIAVKETRGDIIFLRKIVTGSSDKSYGIQVAKMAGLPSVVIARAKEILEQLSENDISQMQGRSRQKQSPRQKKQTPFSVSDSQDGQIGLFDQDPKEEIIEELLQLDLSSMTPLAALNTLNRLQEEAKDRHTDPNGSAVSERG